MKNIFKRLLGKKEKTMENEEKIPGGLAEGLSLEDIAAKHNIPVEELKIELEKGIVVEKEHTPDEKTAAEIAKDHLVENPKYYEVLKKVEQTAVKPEEPKPNYEELIEKAVALALEKMEAAKKKEIEEAKIEMEKKLQVEVEKAKKEAERLQNENAELRRTQPMGIPDLKAQFGSVERTETERAHEAAKGYRKGFRGY